MKLLKGLAIVLVGLFALLMIGGMFLPSTAQLERSIVIERPASVIFPLLNSYQRFNEWSPWFDLDPKAAYTYSGPQTGVGASMAWKGDDKVGTGKQTITASVPDSSLATDLDFGEMGIAKAEMKLAAEGAATRVTWTFATELGSNPINRYFGLLMDKFVGADYDRGLAKLKKLAETLPNVDLAGADIQIVEVSAKPILYVTASSTQDTAAIAQAYGQAYSQIGPVIAAAGVEQAGAPMGIDNYWDERGYGFDAAIPVSRNDIELAAPVQSGQSYAGRAVRVRHVGSYAGLEASQKQGAAYIEIYALKAHDRVYTEFVSDPGNTPEAELISDIYLPIE